MAACDGVNVGVFVLISEGVIVGVFVLTSEGIIVGVFVLLSVGMIVSRVKVGVAVKDGTGVSVGGNGLLMNGK